MTATAMQPDPMPPTRHPQTRDPKSARILIVDDQKPNVILLDRMLRADGFTNVVSTTDPREVEALYRAEPCDLILLDLAMPHLDGFAVMARLSAIQPEVEPGSYLPILVLTAQPDRETRLRALKAGAKDFVGKPFDTLEVMTRIRNMLEVRLSHVQLQAQNARLDELVTQRSRELDEARLEMIRRLGRAAVYRDNETGQHIERMSGYCACIARKLGLPEKDCALIAVAARMHDIGKIGTPDHILLKPGKLDADEWVIMREHTTVGHEILSGSDSPRMQAAATIAHAHHEKWDGSGYPAGLAGEAIPLYGRIASICDVFDALTMERPYKRAWPVKDAAAYIREQSGQHFDPRIVKIFLAALPEIEEIKQRYADI